MDEPIYRQPTPFRPVAQPGGGQIAVLSQPVGNGASLAAALMRGSGGGARSIGHGIGQAASKIAAAGIAKRDKEETAKRNEALARLLTDPNATPEQVAAGFAAAGDYSIAKDAYNRRVNPPKPEITEDATGRKRYLTGPSAGQYVFPDVQMKPKGGFVTLTNPKDNSQVTVRDDDPRADELIGTGYVKMSKPVAEVNIDSKGRTKYAEKIGESYANSFIELQTSGKQAHSALNTLDIMEAAVRDPRFYSGFGGPMALRAKQALVAMGVKDPGDVKSSEAFSTQSKKAALDAMGGSLGAGFSNADRDFVEGQVPSLENTKEGNLLVIEINRRIAKRKIDIAKMARQYVANSPNKEIDAGFDDQLAEWSASNPLFGDLIEQYGEEQKDPLKGMLEPSQQAVEFLKANPDTADQFDAKFGDGAAKRALGE